MFRSTSSPIIKWVLRGEIGGGLSLSLFREGASPFLLLERDRDIVDATCFSIRDIAEPFPGQRACAFALSCWYSNTWKIALMLSVVCWSASSKRAALIATMFSV